MQSAAFDRLLEDPSDVAAVRVWGDALLADGDLQGEAIQLACTLETMALAAPKRRAIERRLAELVERYERVWCGALLDALALRESLLGVGLVRGVPAHLAGPAPVLADVLDDLARVAPIVSLAPNLTGDSLGRVAACSAFAKLGRLDLTTVWHTQTSADYAHVFESANSPALEHLILGKVEPAALESLARCQRLERLARLEIRTGEGIPWSSIAPVVREVGPHLEVLALGTIELGAVGLATIAEHCPALRELTVEDCGIDADAARALAGASWPALERLAIGGNPLGNAGITAIASATSLANLTHLSLSRRSNTPAFGAPHLALLLDRIELPKLVALALDNCLIRAAGATALAACKRLGKLEQLSLCGAGLGVDGALALARAPWGNLRTVALERNQMTTKAIEALADAPWLATVEQLSLVDNNFKTGGAKALAASPHLRSLRVLELGNNWLGSQGIAALLRTRLAATLEDIHTRPGTGNNYGAAILEEFVASDDLTLRYLDCHEATGDMIEAIASCPRARSLRRLTVPASALYEACATRFAASPHLADLGRLEIRGVLADRPREILVQRFGPRLVAHPRS